MTWGVEAWPWRAGPSSLHRARMQLLLGENYQIKCCLKDQRYRCKLSTGGHGMFSTIAIPCHPDVEHWYQVNAAHSEQGRKGRTGRDTILPAPGMVQLEKGTVIVKVAGICVDTTLLSLDATYPSMSRLFPSPCNQLLVGDGMNRAGGREGDQCPPMEGWPASKFSCVREAWALHLC